MPGLFDPYTLKDVTLRNRIGVSPMCQYSCDDGFATDWHLVHLGSRAVGGAGLVIMEAAGVEARGRITSNDLGIYKDQHVEMLSRIVKFIHAQGSIAGIQLAHAGRKGSTAKPWDGGKAVAKEQGGWTPIGPDTNAFEPTYPKPAAMKPGELTDVKHAFGFAAERALAAGFKWLEVHAAHGYLLHEFLSPLSNTRTDNCGGSFENRIRFPLEVIALVRELWPERLPLAVRISATDWTDGGWDLEQSIELSRRLKSLGVDLIDCSSGGNAPDAKIEIKPGYQVPFSAAIRKQVGIATAAVGLITEPQQASAIIEKGEGDIVLLARELLRNPYWPLHAAYKSHHTETTKAPVQYERAFLNADKW